MARSRNRNTAAQNARVEFYIDTKGEYRWRGYAQNGNIVGGPEEGYKRRSGAEKGFNALYAAMMALPGPARNVSVTKRVKKPQPAPELPSATDPFPGVE
jgi:uncharacterized protein YegP (UPF0339 family)